MKSSYEINLSWTHYYSWQRIKTQFDWDLISSAVSESGSLFSMPSLTSRLTWHWSESDRGVYYNVRVESGNPHKTFHLDGAEFSTPLHFRDEAPIEGLQWLSLSHWLEKYESNLCVFWKIKVDWWWGEPVRGTFLHLSEPPKGCWLKQMVHFTLKCCYKFSRQKSWWRCQPAVIAWMSPVKCRLNSSIGITLVIEKPC